MKPLAADTGKLSAAVTAAEASGASDEVVATAKAKLAAAQQAQSKRDKATKVLRARSAVAPLAVNIPALMDAMAVAEESVRLPSHSTCVHPTFHVPSTSPFIAS